MCVHIDKTNRCEKEGQNTGRQCLGNMRKRESDENKERDDRETTVFILLLPIPTTNLCVPKLSLLHIFFGPPNIQNSFWGQAFPLVLSTPKPLEHLVISQYN